MAGLKSRDFAILQVQRAGAGGGVRCSVECFEALGGCLPGRSTGCALRSLSRSGSFIRDLSISLRSGPQRDPRFRTSEDRGFDLQATAFLQGISVFELERRLRGRRRQTARIAYATFALGCIFLMAWVCEALSSPWKVGRVIMALEFLPFCALFYLLALYNTLLTSRCGSAAPRVGASILRRASRFGRALPRATVLNERILPALFAY